MSSPPAPLRKSPRSTAMPPASFSDRCSSARPAANSKRTRQGVINGHAVLFAAKQVGVGKGLVVGAYLRRGGDVPRLDHQDASRLGCGGGRLLGCFGYGAAERQICWCSS